MTAPSGPLRGLRIVEFAAIGPAPFAAMMLSDMGAEVVRIVRPNSGVADARDITSRGRKSVELDLKRPADVEQALRLLDNADVLIEGFRPRVMERLGLGPEEVLKRNQRLVYSRMTGWGQSGPLAHSAGHDINYIAVTGALDAIRSSDGRPVAPLNLVGDYGGGALFLVVGVLAAAMEAKRSGLGQVVDCAMCDGVVNLLSMFHSLSAMNLWDGDKPGTNFLDGGAHFYRTYECSDGKFVAVGAIESQFYAVLCRIIGIEDAALDNHNDSSVWPHLEKKMSEIFRSRTRAEWVSLLEGTDACATGVLSLHEAPHHPHLAARGTFLEHEGVVQPAPAPRFMRTPSMIQSAPTEEFHDIAHIIRSWTTSRAA
jgi:alpha-methylacyl-CoA racemase